MKIAIMQPYLMPYLGYFQLIKSVDLFILYDNIKFTKRGWIQRNRILSNGKELIFSIPLKKDSDYLNIVERKLSDQYINHNKKILLQIESAYRKAPYYEQTLQLLNNIFLYNEHSNLFEFLIHSIKSTCHHLEISTKITPSSSLKNCNHSLKSEKRIFNICKTLGYKEYINPIGGTLLYNKQQFIENNININFLYTLPINYKQLDNKFTENLSIIDVLMCNGISNTKDFLFEYELK